MMDKKVLFGVKHLFGLVKADFLIDTGCKMQDRETG